MAIWRVRNRRADRTKDVWRRWVRCAEVEEELGGEGGRYNRRGEGDKGREEREGGRSGD
jgi:hypothetical protein